MITSETRQTKCGGCRRLVNYNPSRAFAHKVVCPGCYEKLMSGEINEIILLGLDKTIESHNAEVPKRQNKQPFYAKFLK